MKANLLLPFLLLGNFLFAQAPKKVAGTKPLDLMAVEKARQIPGHDEGELVSYSLGLGTSSKNLQPDPKLAGSQLTINFVATPTQGHTLRAVYVNFVADANSYQNALFEETGKAVYLTLPLSYYKPLMDMIAATIDNPSTTKKLKAFYFDEGSGKSTCLIVPQ